MKSIKIALIASKVKMMQLSVLPKVCSNHLFYIVETPHFNSNNTSKFLNTNDTKGRKKRPHNIATKRDSQRFNMRDDIESAMSRGDQSALVNKF